MSVHDFKTYHKVASTGLRLEMVKGYISSQCFRGHLKKSPLYYTWCCNKPLLLWHWYFLNEHIFTCWCSELWPHTSVNYTPVGSVYHNLWYLIGENNTFFSLSDWNRILILSRLINHRNALSWIFSTIRNCMVYLFCSKMIKTKGRGNILLLQLPRCLLDTFWTNGYIIKEIPHFQLH